MRNYSKSVHKKVERCGFIYMIADLFLLWQFEPGNIAPSGGGNQKPKWHLWDWTGVEKDSLSFCTLSTIATVFLFIAALPVQF